MTGDGGGQQPPDNAKIANLLKQIAGMLEFQNENSFKIRAYQMAAETIEATQLSIAEMVAQGGASGLQKIPGIGKGISAQIVEIVQTGQSDYFSELTTKVPATVLDLRTVSGIGLKTAQLLYRDFGVKSLDDLHRLAEGDGLKSVPGLGEKTIARIKASLERKLER